MLNMAHKPANPHAKVHFNIKLPTHLVRRVKHAAIGELALTSRLEAK